MSKLLIVESPTKANTIRKMLGNNYTVIASMGHVRNLPEHELGVDIANGFAPQYVDTPRSKAVVKQLREAAAAADEIYLAPDPDREGEAIAWHLWNVLQKSTKSPFYRVTFHEITRSAIEQALSHKGEVNQHLVDAQQARRILDRIVGYQTSPLLWRHLEKGSSAGRVQSAALRLVVEREREILAFQPEEYWNFAAEFKSPQGELYHGRLFKIDGRDFKIPSGKEAMKLEQKILSGKAPVIAQISCQERRRFAAPPFTTSTLQQAASSSLHFSATNTMRYAQQLYEGVELGSKGAVGLITYMRTDSVTIAKEAQQSAAEFIRQTYGAEYVPEHFNVYKNKAAAQEAHEAIRPTDVTRTPEMVKDYLDPQQLKLYTLIWKRFVASQMSCCRTDQTTVDTVISSADREEFTFRSVGSVVKFPGFTKLYEYADRESKENDESKVLGKLQNQMGVELNLLEKAQKFTEPPPRYNEASLIKALEDNGIGRPSTYATIMKTIQDREYVKRDQGRLIPTELGYKVNDFLVAQLPELFNIGFTAQMEQQLDDIEEGRRPWVGMMQEFYNQFIQWLTAAKHAGAPSEELADTLLKCLENIKFAEPKKVGRRTYDDHAFVQSIRSKLEQDHQITAKQFQALQSLAARYLSQLSIDQLKTLPDNMVLEIQSEAENLVKKAAEQEKAAELAGDIDYTALFKAFEGVEFAPPVKRGRTTYDDKKFFDSLKKQALSGKVLSEKQTEALGKIALRYRQSITNWDCVSSILKLENPAEIQEEPAAPEAENRPETAELIAGLSRVTTWAEPVKKGRFSYDDKKFFESLKKQFESGKSLSAKQLAALQKLAQKYGVQA